MTITYSRKSASECAPIDPGGFLTISNLPRNFDTAHGITPLCRDLSVSTTMGPACATGVGSSAFAASTRGWVPCTEVTVCNRPPVGRTISADRRTLTLEYSNLPWGCRIAVMGTNVDPALNASFDPTFPRGTTTAAAVASCYSCPAGYTGGPKCPATLNGCTPQRPPSTGGGGGGGGGRVGGGDGDGGGNGPDGGNGGLGGGDGVGAGDGSNRSN